MVALLLLHLGVVVGVAWVYWDVRELKQEFEHLLKGGGS